MPDTVTVDGPDAAAYLQGQVTQDLRPLAVGAGTWTFVLEPNGRVVALARVVRVADERFELTVDDGFGGALRDRLARFKLRVKAELTMLEGAPVPNGWPVDEPAVRVTAGWPTMGREIEPGDTIPAETGVNPLAVNFTKGCYTGQELVERMDARQAVAPRRLVRLTGAAPLTVGQELVRDGKVVGRVTTTAGTDALGYVARAVADGAVLDGAVEVSAVGH